MEEQYIRVGTIIYKVVQQPFGNRERPPAEYKWSFVQ